VAPGRCGGATGQLESEHDDSILLNRKWLAHATRAWVRSPIGAAAAAGALIGGSPSDVLGGSVQGERAPAGSGERFFRAHPESTERLGRRQLDVPFSRFIPFKAYTPLEQGRILGNRALGEVAARHGASAAQLALTWLLRQDGMIVIPKATTLEHVRDNRGALDLTLDADDLAALDRAALRSVAVVAASP
jgi:hypothetical protein